MLTKPLLTGILTVASLAAFNTTTSAQELLNPLSWFAPRPSYARGYGVPGYANAACPNGNCNLNRGYTAQYRAANCPNGFCATPNVNNCPDGLCNVPRGGYYAPSNVSRYRTPNTTPWNDNFDVTVPNRAPARYYDEEDFYVPTVPRGGYYGPTSRRPVLDRSVTPTGYDWDTDVITVPRRSYPTNGSPFYP